MLQPFNQSTVAFIFTEVGVTATNQPRGSTTLVQNLSYCAAAEREPDQQNRDGAFGTTFWSLLELIKMAPGSIL